MYGCSSTLTTRTPSASDASVSSSAPAALRVARELPRRALLDVPVQPPDALPDQLERLGRPRGGRTASATSADRPSKRGHHLGIGRDRGNRPIAIAEHHRDRPAREVPVLVGQLGLVARADRVDPDGPVATERHVAHQVEAQRVGAVLVDHLERVEHVAERLAHLAAVGAEQEAVDEHVIRDGEVGRHQHRRPEDRVELEDVLADQVVRGGPEAAGRDPPPARAYPSAV